MLHVMKRRKFESTAPLPYSHQPMQQQQSHHHHLHHHHQAQQLYSNASPVVSSYASLQQQLHLQQQQQRLTATALATSQQGPMPSSTGLYGATTGNLLLQRPSHDTQPKRRYEDFQTQQQQQYRSQAQRPQYSHVRAPQFCAPTSPEASALTPLFPPTSAASASPSGTATATRARIESPQSLPGISAMLRRPTTTTTASTSTGVPQPVSHSSSTSAAPDASRQSLTLVSATRQSSTESLNGSLSQSPMELQGAAAAGAGFAPLAAKWTPEMTSISPMKAIPAIALSATSTSSCSTSSSSMVYYDSRQLASSALSLVSATKLPAMRRPTANRSTSSQSFDVLERKNVLPLTATNNNNSTSRSDASSFARSLASQHHGAVDPARTNSMLLLPPASSASATSGDERIANPNKNSRYLREMDRREILSRIDAGEKQATLAKEYQVSRAAICNLNKHREEVMLRKDENPLAKHPKKPRPKAFKIKTRASKASKKTPSPRTTASSNSHANSRSATSITSKSSNTHEVKSRAAALLLTSVRNKNTSAREFARSSERLLRLLLEDALALVPIKPIEVFLDNCVRADGVGWEHPPCAISLEQAPGASCPLLQLFRSMEPEQPTARATIAADNNNPNHCSTPRNNSSVQVELADASQLPSSLQYHNVFVLALSVTTTADAVCAAISTLLARGAVESMLSLVVVFITSDVIQSVQSKFPSVKIVAAQIDPSGKTPPRALTAAASDDASAQPSDEHSASASPPCCLEVVLDRFRQALV